MNIGKVELDIAKELINQGLAKAADSIAFFAKGKILLKGLDIKLKKLHEIEDFPENKTGDLTILTTHVLGDFEGSCFLVLDSNDTDKILSLGLPPSILENKEAELEMGKAFLLELDNMVSAAVITVFSDFLNKNIHGYVPEYEKLDSTELTAFINNSTKVNNNVLYFKVNLVGDHIDVSPSFIWIMGNGFIDGIKSFINDDKNSELLASIKLEMEKRS